jgi:hypothetical protein
MGNGLTSIDQILDLTETSVNSSAITDTLFVSPNGDGSTGKSWRTAYTTIQDALDNAGTNSNDLTLILIAPQTGASNYDINRTGDPEWSCNVILKGSHRNWVKVKNDHVTATSIMKLTGLAALVDINFNLGAGSTNGIIMTHGGFRIDKCMFVAEDLTGAATIIHIDGAVEIKHGKIRYCDIRGSAAHSTGILFENVSCSEISNCRIGLGNIGTKIIGATSDYNFFRDVLYCNNSLALDIDDGNIQDFENITFVGNTINVDDEVGDSLWKMIKGQFSIKLAPDNFTGIVVNTHLNANTWGVDTEIIAAGTIDAPFRITGIQAEGSAAEKFRIRLSADSGSTFFDDVQIEGEVNSVKRQIVSTPSGTDYVFNGGTRISTSAKSESGNDTVWIWVEYQEI